MRVQTLFNKIIIGAVSIISLLYMTPGTAVSQELDSIEATEGEVFFTLESAMKNPDSVFVLILKRERLKEFPMEIFEFVNLEELDLSKNKIETIPKEISGLKNLQIFNISKNKLTRIPPEIGSLTKLKELIIFQNEIPFLPPEIGLLTDLEFLDLWGNEIGRLPVEISRLRKLATLDLRVIEINDDEQKTMKDLLPNTKIHFSRSCNCGG